MAVLYPILIDGFRFFVNPTKMDITKRSQITEVRTMGGTVFQVWPDLPDEISFSGVAYGTRSIAELRGLSDKIERNPDNKLVTLVYKFNKYNGYIKDLKITADAEKPRQWEYSFTFIVRDPRFKSESLVIGQTTGLAAEFDFFSAQLRQASTEIASLPADIANNAENVYGQIFGKTGSKEHGLGLFIGRPRSSPFLKRNF